MPYLHRYRYEDTVTREATEEDLYPGKQVGQGCHCAAWFQSAEVSGISVVGKDFLLGKHKHLFWKKQKNAW